MPQTPRTPLLDQNGMISRAAVQREARRQYEQAQRLGLGWTLAQCLRFSWHKARGQKELSVFNQVERAARGIMAASTRQTGREIEA